MEAVIFDFDGVIIDSEKIYHEIETGMFRELGIEVTEEEHDAIVGVVPREAWQTLKTSKGLKQSVEELVERERKLYSAHICKHGVALVPGVNRLIESISRAGIILAVASSSYEEEIGSILDKAGLKKHFTAIVGGERVGRGKPAPDIFLLAANEIGVAPGKCMVIEDSCQGVRAAKAAGMVCTAYKNKWSGKQDLSAADAVVEDFNMIDCKFLKEIWNRSTGYGI